MKLNIKKNEVMRIIVGGVFMAMGSIVMELMDKADLNATIQEEVNKQLIELNAHEEENETEEV